MKFEKVSLEIWEKYYPEKYVPNKGHSTQTWEDIKLPQRATSGSMGYDLYSPFAFTLEVGLIIKLPLGIKFNPGAYGYHHQIGLLIYPRSGLGSKGLNLLNQTGVIDPDYYGNPSTGGLIFAALVNNGRSTIHIEKGQAILQGILTPFYVTEDDQPRTAKRMGGFGSTDE